jgi:hypothetical protein
MINSYNPRGGKPRANVSQELPLVKGNLFFHADTRDIIAHDTSLKNSRYGGGKPIYPRGLIAIHLHEVQ